MKKTITDLPRNGYGRDERKFREFPRFSKLFNYPSRQLNCKAKRKPPIGVRSLNRAETRGEGKIILQRKIILRFVRFISRIRFINRMFRPGRAVIRSHGQRRAETRERIQLRLCDRGNTTSLHLRVDKGDQG